MKFVDRIVVFLDILGFASMVEAAAERPEGDEAKRLEKALNMIRNLKLHQADRFAPGTKLSSKHDAKLNVQIFSDSVIMSIIPDSESVKELMIMLSRLFINLMTEGIYVRGGISFDKISHNPASPCGPAVNQAYRLESGIADFPRIILGRTAVEYCRTAVPDILDGTLIERNSEDGIYSLTPIKYATENSSEDQFGMRASAEAISDHLSRNLRAIVDQPKNFRKINELAVIWNMQVHPRNGFFTTYHKTDGYVDLADSFEEALDHSLDEKVLLTDKKPISSLPEAP